MTQLHLETYHAERLQQQQQQQQLIQSAVDSIPPAATSSSSSTTAALLSASIVIESHSPSTMSASNTSFTPSSSGSIPWPAAATGSSDSSGFSFTRFFSRRASQKAPMRGGEGAGGVSRNSSMRGVYLHRPLQKRPTSSSTSSSYGDYREDASSGVRKERSPDGFPVITLTSPTNSETSIPRREDYSMAAPEITPVSDFGGPSAARATEEAATPATSSSPSWLVDPDMTHNNKSSTATMEKTLFPTESPRYQPQHPMIPQHMFLHPLSTFKRAPSLPPPSSSSPTRVSSETLSSQTNNPSSPTSRTDFPPTYEEAVDAGASSSSCRSCPSPGLSADG
ncbi:hypothetical protein BGZ83_005393 [Gryganskiella cystojenkinii]|nr:hypothetical protein BGZ83_005393 [Gryganskiella cystojenkinii]